MMFIVILIKRAKVACFQVINKKMFYLFVCCAKGDTQTLKTNKTQKWNVKSYAIRFDIVNHSFPTQKC